MRTAGVKHLVNEVLERLAEPHTEDVIDDVFHDIEHDSAWRERYDALCDELGRTVVNTWAGFWIAHSEERSGMQQVPARKSTLIESYSKLTAASKKRGLKVREPEALKMMADYYRENRSSLPASVRKHRELIVDLIMEGYSAQEAFSKVKSQGT